MTVPHAWRSLTRDDVHKDLSIFYFVINFDVVVLFKSCQDKSGGQGWNVVGWKLVGGGEDRLHTVYSFCNAMQNG